MRVGLGCERKGKRRHKISFLWGEWVEDEIFVGLVGV